MPYDHIRKRRVYGKFLKINVINKPKYTTTSIELHQLYHPYNNNVTSLISIVNKKIPIIAHINICCEKSKFCPLLLTFSAGSWQPSIPVVIPRPLHCPDKNPKSGALLSVWTFLLFSSFSESTWLKRQTLVPFQTFYVQIYTIIINSLFFFSHTPVLFLLPSTTALHRQHSGSGGSSLVKSIPTSTLSIPPHTHTQWTSSSLSFNLWLAVPQGPP